MNGSALGFSAGRREEAQMIVQLMMRTVLKEDYRGSFHVSEAMPVFIEGAPREARNAYFGMAIGAACAAWGAEPMEQSFEEEGPDEAPCEILLFGASMPVSKLCSADEQEAQMVEACAEVMRVILAGAIITAKEDCSEGDKVLAVFRAMPDVVVEPDLTAGTLTVLFRAAVKVVRQNNPRTSYVLGNQAGSAPKQLSLPIPMADLFYGPKRIRWLDQRSPGHLVQEQVARVLS